NTKRKMLQIRLAIALPLVGGGIPGIAGAAAAEVCERVVPGVAWPQTVQKRSVGDRALPHCAQLANASFLVFLLASQNAAQPRQRSLTPEAATFPRSTQKRLIFPDGLTLDAMSARVNV